MDDIQQLTKLYQEAEEILKEIERDTQEGLVVPAINELRYAGFHLLRSLNSDDPRKRAAELTSAESHAKRAIFDAVEVGVLDKMGTIKRFQNDYRLVAISDVVPSYIDKVSTIRKIQQLVNKYNMHNRADHYEECMDYYRQLGDMVDVFEDARPELNKRMRTRRNTALVIILTTLLAVFAMLPSYIDLYNNHDVGTAAAQPASPNEQRLEKNIDQK